MTIQKNSGHKLGHDHNHQVHNHETYFEGLVKDNHKTGSKRHLLQHGVKHHHCEEKAEEPAPKKLHRRKPKHVHGGEGQHHHRLGHKRLPTHSHKNQSTNASPEKGSPPKNDKTPEVPSIPNSSEQEKTGTMPSQPLDGGKTGELQETPVNANTKPSQPDAGSTPTSLANRLSANPQQQKLQLAVNQDGTQSTDQTSGLAIMKDKDGKLYAFGDQGKIELNPTTDLKADATGKGLTLSDAGLNKIKTALTSTPPTLTVGKFAGSTASTNPATDDDSGQTSFYNTVLTTGKATVPNQDGSKTEVTKIGSIPTSTDKKSGYLIVSDGKNVALLDKNMKSVPVPAQTLQNLTDQTKSASALVEINDLAKKGGLVESNISTQALPSPKAETVSPLSTTPETPTPVKQQQK